MILKWLHVPKRASNAEKGAGGRAAGHSGTDFWPWGGCGSPAASDSSRQPALSCSWGESGLLRTKSASGGTPSCPAQGRPWPKPEVLSLTPNQAGGQVLGARSWERQRLGLQVLAHPNRSGQSAAPEGLAVLLGAARGRGSSRVVVTVHRPRPDESCPAPHTPPARTGPSRSRGPRDSGGRTRLSALLFALRCVSDRIVCGYLVPPVRL